MKKIKEESSFLKKKKQKDFISAARLRTRAPWCHRGRSPDKRFLVLFFKKERFLLPSFPALLHASS